MGMFSSVLGGMVGAGVLQVVQGAIEKQGGVAAVVDKFEKQGLGATVRSWVSTGPNLPVTPDQVHQALGADTVAQLAAKFGLSHADLLQKLAQVLPEAVDKLTPDGKIPQA